MKTSTLLPVVLIGGSTFPITSSDWMAHACASRVIMEAPPTAFITSERAIYRAGEPIDLTFSVAVPKTGQLLPAFEIMHESGEAAPAIRVGGRYFWETPGTAIDGTQRSGAILPVKPDADSNAAPTSAGHTEIVADVRRWYEFDAIGMYTISFDGQWIDEKGESHPVTSNTIRVWMLGPGGEIEPCGEPIQSREIPLAEIWALDMPGTQPMETAVGAAPDGDRDVAPEGTMVRQILRAINKHEWPRRNAPPGFAVGGTGMDALREAHAVLVHGQRPRTQFTAGEQISLVFFSRNYARRIHLDRAEVYNSTVQVHYRTYTTWPSAASVDTSHLALIPFTVPETNQTRVEVRPVIDWISDSPPPPSLEHLAHRVCHPFTIEISQ